MKNNSKEIYKGKEEKKNVNSSTVSGFVSLKIYIKINFTPYSTINVLNAALKKEPYSK